MKVVLIRPDPRRYYYSVLPPMGLAYLHRALQSMGAQVEIWDLGQKTIREEKKLLTLKTSPPDLVGIQVFTRSLVETRRLLGEIGCYLPDSVPVVAGGAHPSSAPEHTLRYLQRVNYLLIGEADESLPLLARVLSDQDPTPLREIPGIAFTQDAGVYKNPYKLPLDLDRLGHVDWISLDPLSYKSEIAAGMCKRSPAATIISSRGCPFHCSYCAARVINGHRVRRHSIDYILEDVEILHKKYGIQEIRFYDDNFVSNKKYVHEFCETVRKRNLDVAFSLPNGIRLEQTDEEIIDDLKSIGFYKLAFGIESGSPRILKMMNRFSNMDLIKKRIKLVKSKGLETGGLFVLGYPTEKHREIMATIRFSKILDLDVAHFNTFAPFPGTQISKQLEEEGKLKGIPWEHIQIEAVKYSFCELTKGQLKRIRKRAILEFYLRPSILWKFLRNIRSYAQLKFLALKLLEYR